ncbi:hypothetical protein DL767_008697 [Monosporascus sp. MG133]|nr:hypothetical protein DL767_008697 [Monosporascus sp. MG133]
MASSAPSTALEHFDQNAASYEASTGGCTKELAQHVLGLWPEIDADSVILDNACGTGIVAAEIIQRLASRGIKPTLHLVDGAPNMVDITRSRLGRFENVQCAVMPGEKLDFPDETFSHSVTNLGILFFADGDQGAREIFRTLKPGGTAIVTSWRNLGYLQLIQESQQAVRPQEPVVKLPISEAWFQLSHLEQTLRKGGFEQVEISTPTVHYASDNVEGICALLLSSFRRLIQEWSGEEQEKFKGTLQALVGSAVEEFKKADGSTAVGIPMIATAAVCKK